MKRLTTDDIHSSYIDQKPKLISRLRRAGRTLEDAEDLVQDVFAETVSRMPDLSGIRNIGAWINSLFTRRAIDLWRHKKVEEKAGIVDTSQELITEVITSAGFNPLDEFVRENLVDALYDAIRLLPKKQRHIIEAQVFKGKSFQELADESGESINTLMARKRYAILSLGEALKDWVESD